MIGLRLANIAAYIASEMPRIRLVDSAQSSEMMEP